MLCNKRSRLQPPSDGSREQIEAIPMEVPGVGCQTDTKQTNEMQGFEESRSVLTPESRHAEILHWDTKLDNLLSTSKTCNMK